MNTPLSPKKIMRTSIAFGLTALWLILQVGPIHAQPYHNVPGAIHLDSNISGGHFSPEKLIRIVQKNGLRVAIITDHDTMRWEYGFGPFRSLMARISGNLAEMPSIATYGTKDYVETVEALDRKYPNVIVIHGAEAIPFYYWEGSIWDSNLALKNGNKHLLVIGLEKASDYEHLPSVGRGFMRRFTGASILGLWPLVLIVWGMGLIRVKKTRVVGNLLIQHYRPYTIFGIVCLLVGPLFLINNYPFSLPKYDPYHGDQGVAPYQDFIDYVNDRGGMVFWAHPEAYLPRTYDLPIPSWLQSIIPAQQVQVETPPYHEDLLAAYDYTGFGAFAEGIKYTIPPGGIWDQILLEYCQGLRAKPVWGIGEVDYEENTFSIKEVQTVFLLETETKVAVLEALRTGKMYAVLGSAQGTEQITLDAFIIENLSGTHRGYMGDEITSNSKPRIKVKVTSAGRVNADLIRNGSVIRSFTSEGNIDIDFVDDTYQPGKKIFYRLDIKGPARIVSNPIFVRFVE